VTANAWIVLTFLVCTLPWYLALSAVAGWQLTFDSVFVAGARTAWAFYEPIVPPNRDALEAILWIVAGGGLLAGFGWLADRGRLSARRVAIGLLLALTLVAAVLVWRSLVERQALPAYLADNLWARWVRTANAPNDLPRFLPFLAEAAGIGLLVWRRLSGHPDAPRVNLLLWFCVLFVFQLYPHASYLHVLFSWGPFLVLLAAVASELWQATAPRLPTRCWRCCPSCWCQTPGACGPRRSSKPSRWACPAPRSSRPRPTTPPACGWSRRARPRCRPMRPCSRIPRWRWCTC
jgi:hypothetical protein